MENDTAASREVWLTIALAVARDGLPTPRHFSVHDRIIGLSLETHTDLRKWAEHFGLDESRIHLDSEGGLWAPHFVRDGWSYQVACYQPNESPTGPSSLAEELVEAICPAGVR